MDVTNDANDQNVKMVLSTNEFSVVDQYGKRLLINSHDDLLKFIDAVIKSRENFKIKLDGIKFYSIGKILNRSIDSLAFNIDLNSKKVYNNKAR